MTAKCPHGMSSPLWCDGCSMTTVDGGLPTWLVPEVLTLLGHDPPQKIEAIKLVRTRLDWSLIPAKNAVDALQNKVKGASGEPKPKGDDFAFPA